MRFWDSSAVVPFLVDEPARPRMLSLLESDHDLTVWWGTPVECTSAIARRERLGDHDATATNIALARLGALQRTWREVAPSEQVRDLARRLLRVHPLRAPDALQLAAALTAADGEPTTLAFVTLDERLASCARREGFEVVA